MIGRKYELGSMIGQGQFGQVFEGTYRKHQNQNQNRGQDQVQVQERVAIKIEYADAPIHTLKHEATLLQYLYEHGCRTTPPIYWYGLHNSLVTMIIPWYEMSLHQYMASFRPSPAMIRDTVIAMVDILETIHSHYVIHRDIKPQNFMIRRLKSVKGSDPPSQLDHSIRGGIDLVLIDFGLASVYMDGDEHIPCKTDKTTLIGSPKFASIHIHQGIEPSRRDDMISMGYIGYLMSQGHLPWEQSAKNGPNIFVTDCPINRCDHPANQERLHQKMEVGSNTAFGHLLKCLYEIGFDETPNYAAIRAFVIGQDQAKDRDQA